MRNRNGFTLVEVLGVIVILGILALLVTNSILGYFSEGKSQYDKKLSDQLALSGKTYFSEHKELLPTAVSDRKYAYVTAAEMQSNNYIKNEFVDSENRECSSSYVFVTEKEYNTGNYEYIPCLICIGEDGEIAKHFKDDIVFCDPSRWHLQDVILPDDVDDIDVCAKIDQGFYDDGQGECVCPSYKQVIDGACVCPGADMVDNGEGCVCPEGKVMSGNQCVCPSNQIEIEGKCQCPPAMSWDGEACVCPAGKVFKNNQCVCPDGYEEDSNGNCVRLPNVCALLDKGYTNGPNGECLCNSPRVVRNGECVCPVGYVEKNGTCLCIAPRVVRNNQCVCPTDKGYVEENGKCLCKSPKVEVNGVCQCPAGTTWNGTTCVSPPNTCTKIDKGYTDVNGTCVCKAPKVEENGVCKCQSNKVWKNGTCVCPDGMVWNATTKKCEIIDDTIPSEFTCKGTYDTATKEYAITATSNNGISRLFYRKSGTSTPDYAMSVTSTEKNTGKITNRKYKKGTDGNAIPANASIRMEDYNGTISGACKISDLECSAEKQSRGYANAAGGECKCDPPKVEKTIDGKKWCLSTSQLDSPKCECSTIPSDYVGASGATFKIRCHNDDTAIKTLSGWKNKITLRNGNGTLTSLDATPNSTEKVITISGKYVPSSGIEKKDRILVAAAMVANKNNTDKKNTAVTCDWMYADTKGPKITYTITEGTFESSNGSGQTKKCYRGGVKVKATCEDDSSGVKTFKVNGDTVSTPKTKHFTSCGDHSLTSSCTDKKGNSTTGPSKSYLVCVKSGNCSKCGCAAYNSCVNSSCSCKTREANCSKCGGVEIYKTCYYHKTATAQKSYEDPKLPNPHYNDYATYCNNNCSKSSQSCNITVYGYKLQKQGGGHTYIITPYKCKSSGSYSNSSCGSYSPKKYSSCYRCSSAACQTYNSCVSSKCSCKTCGSCWHYC